MKNKEKLIHIGKNMYELMPLFASKIHIERIRETLNEKGFEGTWNKSHIRTIFLIGKKKNLISSDLGKLIGLERGSVTSMVRYLMEEGYVEKIQCKNDKRKQFLILTQGGKEVVEELNKLYINEIDEAFSKLSDEEINEFVESLDKLISIIHRL